MNDGPLERSGRSGYTTTMYAKNLAHFLHEALVRPDPLSDTLKRFEHLRGFGLLPRGRENAGVRLDDKQIASAVLGFAPIGLGFAGLASLSLGGLCSVGGAVAGFRNCRTLQDTMAAILASDDACTSVVALTLTIDRTNQGDDYHARAVFDEKGVRRTISFVSDMALSLLREGAEKTHDHDRIHAPSARQLALGREFFLRLRRDIAVSRHLDLPLKTDWTEYESEEEKSEFHRKLGARVSSRFMNLPVDTAVAWPKEPTLVTFAGHQFVLFPRTKDNSHSISIDLTNQRLSHVEARTLLNRFLSILSWCQDQHAILGDGWSGNPVPVPVRRYDKGGTIAGQWVFDRSLPENKEILQRLAYYREGLNAHEAGLVSYEVLSFFKVFEQRVKGDGKAPNPTKIWIRDNFDAVATKLSPDALKRFEEARGGKPGHKYIFDNCRVATAHASEKFPSDADASLEIRRLYSAAEVIHALARHYLKTEFHLSDSYFSDDAR
ncbi:methylamine utilization protein MauJ [Rhizobium sp. LjRoot258]|uniref:methylamine utilization protein MauJ n=1 Tax=Rhizobium sp. LjRoot258 TaxID=3342299 RepID=UPI003ED002E5